MCGSEWLFVFLSALRPTGVQSVPRLQPSPRHKRKKMVDGWSSRYWHTSLVCGCQYENNKNVNYRKYSKVAAPTTRSLYAYNSGIPFQCSIVDVLIFLQELLKLQLRFIEQPFLPAQAGLMEWHQVLHSLCDSWRESVGQCLLLSPLFPHGICLWGSWGSLWFPFWDYWPCWHEVSSIQDFCTTFMCSLCILLVFSSGWIWKQSNVTYLPKLNI